MEDRVRFLIESLNLIAETQANAERVHAFWRININQIDALPIEIMPEIASQILEARSKEDREFIAGTFGNFGSLIRQFPLGNRAINLELAITSHQICASILTRKEYPSMWAMTQTNLGNAYRNRIEGDRKGNLELAIQAYQAALEVRTRQDFPVD